MATGGGSGEDIFASLTEDLLTCEVCSESFDLVSRPPRVLPCFHCYCGVCLGTLGKEGSVKCPKCRQEAAAGPGFPLETTRVTVMEWLRSVKGQEALQCGICADGSQASSRCQDCNAYICKDCTSNHEKYKCMRSHKVISLSEAAQSPDKVVPHSETCPRHSDEKLKLYCMTCAQPVCSVCALTLHLEGHKFVEVDTVLDDKKKKILSLCEVLEEAERSFQKKGEECQASLRALESQHRQSESQVQEAFSCVVTAVLDRQNQVLEELTATVKRERLRLEEGLGQCQALQAAAQSAAAHGRRLVSISLASQLLQQDQHLDSTAAHLQQRLASPVPAAPSFHVGMERLEELKTLLQSLGTLERRNADGILICDGDVSCCLPDIKLDDSRCHGDCTVSADGLTLTNQPCPSRPSQSQTFQFRGTCGSVALPGQSCYWQVSVKVDPKPQIAETNLCQCGVGHMEALSAARWDMNSKSSNVLTVGLRSSEGSVKLRSWYRGRESLLHRVLAPFNSCSSVECTLGFLLDVPKKRITVIDVHSSQKLWEESVDISQPLWPCVSMRNSASGTKASVRISVESGPQLTLTPGLVTLIRSQLQ